MARYKVVSGGVMLENRVIHEAGAVVELSDKDAAALVANGTVVAVADAPAAAKPKGDGKGN